MQMQDDEAFIGCLSVSEQARKTGSLLHSIPMIPSGPAPFSERHQWLECQEKERSASATGRLSFSSISTGYYVKRYILSIELPSAERRVDSRLQAFNAVEYDGQRVVHEG